MTAETATTATEVMAAQGQPATVTVRRSWAIGGLLAVVVVIVAMAIALAAVASDDGGFPQGPPSGGVPEMRQGGIAPPEGMPDQGALPQLPDMQGGSQGSGSQTNP